MEHRSLPVPDGLVGMRADAALATLLGFSRTFSAEVVQAGGVTLDGRTLSKSDRLHAEGARTVRVLPLYPQYSTTTTEPVADVIAAHAGGMQVSMLRDYHRDGGWAAAVAASIRAHWAVHGRGERLVFSFHGLPQRVVDAGDPYAAQCEASTQAIAAALGIARAEVLLAYQSRFGKGKWLQPDVVATLQGLARDGVRRVDVACPGFAVDCLETLEEMAMQDAALFREAGGDALRYIPCLNAGDAHADALAALARGDEGWR